MTEIGKDDITDAIRSRLADPFIGSLVLAFIGLHWQFFYTLIAGEGKASLTLPKAWSVFTVYSHAWDLVAVIAIAAFYTFVWLAIAGWIREVRERIILGAENRRLKALAEKRLETAATMCQRPEHQEVLRQRNDVHGALVEVWAASNGSGSRLELGHLTEPLHDVGVPRLFQRLDGGALHPFRRDVTAKDAGLVLGFRAIGTKGVLFAENGHEIPWAWPEGVSMYVFVDGAPVALFNTLRDTLPRLEKTEHGRARFMATEA
jgi:hypothetical protein